MQLNIKKTVQIQHQLIEIIAFLTIQIPNIYIFISSFRQYHLINTYFILILSQQINKIDMNEQWNYFATSIIASVTAFSLYKVIKAQSRVSQNEQLLTRIKTTPAKSPNDPFTHGQTAIVSGKVQYNNYDDKNTKIMRTVPSSKNNQQYILYIKYRQAMYSNEHFTNKDQYVIKIKDIIGRSEININQTFRIIGNFKDVIVRNYDMIDYGNILDITRWDNKRRRLTLSQKFQQLMLSYFRAIGTLVVADRGRPQYLRGIDVGTRQVEAGVKVGSSIMALGAITISLQGKIFLEPNLLFKDKLSVMTKISDVIKMNEQSRNFWLVVLLLGGIYVGRRVYLYQRKNDFISKIRIWWNGLFHSTSKAV